ncbi:MAG TPA: phosphoribosyl-ATP diphosphatase [Burkholderiaceae bacterium]|nr:phosphoribosyl-ATP diphosphatase [Burkholderiaceae bacterium]
MSDTPIDIFARVTATIESRKGAQVTESYVAKLFAKGQDAILKKIGEEATELVMAAKDGHRDQIVYEATDLLFHTMVLLAHHGLSLDDVQTELARREGLSGLAEKAARKEG